MTGYVYAISNGRGAVKIGWSDNPRRRLREINISDHHRLRLLGMIEATRDQEQELHRLLANAQIRGEWFSLESAAVRYLVSALPLPSHDAASLQAIFNKHRGMRTRISKALGINIGAVCQWQRVPAERVLAVEAETGISRSIWRPDLYPPEPCAIEIRREDAA